MFEGGEVQEQEVVKKLKKTNLLLFLFGLYFSEVFDQYKG